MNIFNHDSGEYDMVDLTAFFEDVRKDAMNSGLALFKTYGIKGMKEELGSKNPIKLANKMINFFVQYEEYEKCGEIKQIIDEYKKCQTK
jgi:hypothetical protein|tara:strand:- start:1968 stop:2234 length:267 start_codon:yes stop_codon:yes gene_type:complete